MVERIKAIKIFRNLSKGSSLRGDSLPKSGNFAYFWAAFPVFPPRAPIEVNHGRRAAECNPGQVVYTCASVTKQYNLVPAHWAVMFGGWGGNRALRGK